MEITIYTIIIWIVAILIGSLNLVIYLGSNKLSSRAFNLSILWVFLWITAVGLLVSTNDSQTATFYSRLTYYLGSTIASTFLYFFFTFPEDKQPNKKLIIFLIILQAIFTYLFIFTNTIISDVFQINTPSHYGWNFGIFSFLFELTFFGFFIYGVFILYRKYKIQTDLYTKKNLKFMIMTIIVGALPPGMMSIILPRLGIFTFNWLGPVTEIIWIPIIAYSIIKYRQMNVKAVITEVLAISMTTIFFINIFTNVSTNIWLRITIFLVFITLAFYLIRVSLSESRQKEELRKLNAKLKDLNENLEQKVMEQVGDVKRAFVLEQKAKVELEKLNETKDQFIMITQHSLRTPLTAIRWELESMLNGNHGVISEDIRKTLIDTTTATDRLARIIDDFLNITALKVGTQILNISIGNMKKLLEEVLNELKTDIEKLHISIDYPKDKESWPNMKMDISKMKEVILIIIENAVRYNIPNGKIIIENKIKSDENNIENNFNNNLKNREENNEKNNIDGNLKNDKKDIEKYNEIDNKHGIFEIKIKNTGVGITNEDKGNIFTRLFYRGKKAQVTHPIGMGIGLSVARAIARAHHGDITIHSEGENLGAEITISVPF